MTEVTTDPRGTTDRRPTGVGGYVRGLNNEVIIITLQWK